MSSCNFSAKHALALANAAYANTEPNWAMPMIVHLEETADLRAFHFVMSIYEEFAICRKSKLVEKLTAELLILLTQTDTTNCEQLHKRSQEIWENPVEKSFLKRGMSRLYSALAYRRSGDLLKYQWQLMAALSNAIMAWDESPIDAGFTLVEKRFQEFCVMKR